MRTCRARRKDGNSCRRPATKGGACGLKSHQAQLAGRGFGRPEPAKHGGQCKACSSPDRKRAEAEWVAWRLADRAVGQMVGCSGRAWRRHASYTGLYETRAANITEFCSGVMGRSLSAPVSTRDAIAAAALAFKVAQGDERIIIEAIEKAKPELFEALNAARKLPEDTTLRGAGRFSLAAVGRWRRFIGAGALMDEGAVAERTFDGFSDRLRLASHEGRTTAAPCLCTGVPGALPGPADRACSRGSCGRVAGGLDRRACGVSLRPGARPEHRGRSDWDSHRRPCHVLRDRSHAGATRATSTRT